MAAAQHPHFTPPFDLREIRREFDEAGFVVLHSVIDPAALCATPLYSPPDH